MRKRNWFVILFLLLGFLYFGIAYYFSNLILIPPKRSIEFTKKRMANDLGLSMEGIIASMTMPQELVIPSELDKTPLQAWYFEQEKQASCALVLSHGWSDNRAGMLKYAPIFWNCGCDLLLYDHRAHFESGGQYATAGIKEKADLISVTNWLQQKTGLSEKQIGWMGESWGAATALQAGALDKDVAFIIAESPFQNWYSAIFERAEVMYGKMIYLFEPAVLALVNFRAGVNHQEASPIAVANQIVEPVLLLHSKTDEDTAAEQSVNISKHLNNSTSRFHLLDWGAAHAKNSTVKPEAYQRLLYDFIYEKAEGFGSCNF